LTFSYTKY